MSSAPDHLVSLGTVRVDSKWHTFLFEHRYEKRESVRSGIAQASIEEKGRAFHRLGKYDFKREVTEEGIKPDSASEG